MSNRDSCFTAANSHARLTGKRRYAFKDASAMRLRFRSQDGGQRRFGVGEVRWSSPGESAAPALFWQFAQSPVAEPRPFPPLFCCLMRGRTPRLGCARPCAHATTARTVDKKNGRTCGRCDCSVVWSSREAQALRRGSGARRRRTNAVHGWIRAPEPRRQEKKGGKRAAGYYADRMRWREGADVPQQGG